MADIQVIREAFSKREYLFTAHASDRAAKRAIRSGETEQAVAAGEVIEDYPQDKYGSSCLISGVTEAQRPLHMQVSYPPNLKIITVYEPSADEWESDWKTRKT